MAIEPERRAMLAVQTGGISYATLKDFDTLVARIAEQIREAEAAVRADVGAENERLKQENELLLRSISHLTDGKSALVGAE